PRDPAPALNPRRLADRRMAATPRAFRNRSAAEEPVVLVVPVEDPRQLAAQSGVPGARPPAAARLERSRACMVVDGGGAVRVARAAFHRDIGRASAQTGRGAARAASRLRVAHRGAARPA